MGVLGIDFFLLDQKLIQEMWHVNGKLKPTSSALTSCCEWIKVWIKVFWGYRREFLWLDVAIEGAWVIKLDVVRDFEKINKFLDFVDEKI